MTVTQQTGIFLEQLRDCLMTEDNDKPTLIIYGDCQASYMHPRVASIAAVSDRYHVEYASIIQVWDKDAPPALPDIPVERMQNCEIVWYQVGPEEWPEPPSGYLGHIPANAKYVRFPSFYFSAPWFANSPDPMMDAKAPAHPTFPYQDRFLVQIASTGVAVSEGYEVYEELVRRNVGALSRVLEREVQLLARRDANCDVPMTGYIFSNFVRRRLFWNPTNPTNALCEELVRRLISATWPSDSRAGQVFDGVERQAFSQEDSHHFQRHIISRPIAEALGLSWWREDYKYWTRVLDVELTSRDYVERYVAARRQLATADTRW